MPDSKKELVFSADASTKTRHGDTFLARAGVAFNAYASADINCHGLSLSAGLDAMASAEAAAKLEWLEATIKAEAGATSGLVLKAIMSPNLLDTFGLSMVVKAWAKAYVEILLEFGLNIGDLILTSTKLLEEQDNSTQDLSKKILINFIEGIIIKGAVFAKAEAGFAAEGYLLCTGQLIAQKEKGKLIPPGFEISMGGGASWFAGMTYGGYIELEIPELPTIVKPVIHSIIDRIFEAVNVQVALPSFFEKLTRQTLMGALDIAFEFTQEKDIDIETMETLCLKTAQKLLLNMLIEGVKTLFEKHIGINFYALLNTSDVDEAREILIQKIDDAILELETFRDQMTEGDSQVNRVGMNKSFDFIIELLEKELGIDTTIFKKLYAIYWSAGAVLGWDGHKKKNFRKSALINTAYEDFSIDTSGRIKDAALTYLLNVGVDEILFEFVPELKNAFAETTKGLGIPSNDTSIQINHFIALVLSGRVASDESKKKQLVKSIIKFLSVLHEKFIKAQIFDILDNLEKDDSDFRYYSVYFLKPFMQHLDGFIFESCYAVIDNPKSNIKEILKTALISLFYKTISKSAAATITTLTDYVYNNTHQSCTRLLHQLAVQQVDGSYKVKQFPLGKDPVEKLARVFNDKLKEQVGELLGIRFNIPVDFLSVSEASKQLIIDLLAIGKDIFGPEHYTPALKMDYKDILNGIFSLLDTDVIGPSLTERGSGDPVTVTNATYQEWNSCNFLPENHGALIGGISRVVDVTMDQFGEVIRRVPDAFKDYAQQTVQDAIIQPALELLGDIEAFAIEMLEKAIAEAKALMNILLSELILEMQKLKRSLETLLRDIHKFIEEKLNTIRIAFIKEILKLYKLKEEANSSFDLLPDFVTDFIDNFTNIISDIVHATVGDQQSIFRQIFGLSTTRFKTLLLQPVRTTLSVETGFLGEAFDSVETTFKDLKNHKLHKINANTISRKLNTIESTPLVALPSRFQFKNALKREAKNNLQASTLFEHINKRLAIHIPSRNGSIGSIDLTGKDLSSFTDIIVNFLSDGYEINKNAINTKINKINHLLRQLRPDVESINTKMHEINTLMDQRKQIINKNDVKIKILNPVSIEKVLAIKRLSNQKPVLYNRSLSVLIHIEGINETHINFEGKRRLLIKINEKEVTELYENIIFKNNKAIISGKVSDYIKPGINMLSCIVLQQNEKSIRESVTFAADPKNANQQAVAGIAVDERLSNINAIGNDHHNLNDEYITLRNVSSRSINLKGYMLTDNYWHSYTFKNLNLKPNHKVTLYTGFGKDTRTKLYWNRKRAVWNNSFDVIRLFGPKRVPIFEHHYDTGLRWNVLTGRYEN